MTQHFVLELVGYAASVLVAISLMMTSVLRLRLINLVGSAAFSLYGVLIGAYPVAVLNGAIVFVNLYHLAAMMRTKEYFQLLPLKPDSVYLPYFLNYHAAEIRRAVPDFHYRPSADQVTLFILRDCNPAGVFIAKKESEGVLRVLLDFAVPNYRDLRMGRYLFVEQQAFFRERGIRDIVVTAHSEMFGEYLRNLGFAPDPATPGDFRLRFIA
jgi:hypothetical protein